MPPFRHSYASQRNDDDAAIVLKGQCHEIFDFWFFHESVSPRPLSIPIGPFRIFRKLAEIFTVQSASPVLLTLVANGKFFNYFVWTPLVKELTYL
jgi:hypothetical protein